MDDEREESPWLLLSSRWVLSLEARWACALAVLLFFLPPFLGGGIATCPEAQNFASNLLPGRSSAPSVWGLTWNVVKPS